MSFHNIVSVYNTSLTTWLDLKCRPSTCQSQQLIPVPTMERRPRDLEKKLHPKRFKDGKMIPPGCIQDIK